MQRGYLSLFSIFLLFFCTLIVLSQCNNAEVSDNQASPNTTAQAQEQPTPELADYMSQLQYYTHKFALSVTAENQDAADFYFHEIRALAEVIKQDVPGYEGYDIARFMGIFLDPEITPVNDALLAGDWEETRKALISLVDACNTCHRATSHGFVRITPGFDNNPYNQVFESQ